MKWFNTNKTRFIDLSKVSAFDYSPEQSDGFMLDAALLLFVEGCEVQVVGEEAKEIYQILTTEKQVLQG